MTAKELRGSHDARPSGLPVYVAVGRITDGADVSDVSDVSSVPGVSDDCSYVSPADRTRRRLREAGVLAVRLVGPPGSGKTALMEETLWQLRDRLRTAAVVANPAAGRDVERLRRYCDDVQAIETAAPDAKSIEEVVGRINLAGVGVLLIEACGGIVPLPDVGQDETVAVLAVSGGDDKAAEYAHLIAASSLVVLTKVDLRHRVTFDANVFQSDLARLNPRVEVIHLSAYENTSMAAWLDWIEQRRAAKARERVAAQEAAASEWFFG
jgi:hydrogenase nickel incorporation protein HypB